MTNEKGHDKGDKTMPDEAPFVPADHDIDEMSHLEDGSRDDIPANEGGEAPETPAY